MVANLKIWTLYHYLSILLYIDLRIRMVKIKYLNENIKTIIKFEYKRLINRLVNNECDLCHTNNITNIFL